MNAPETIAKRILLLDIRDCPHSFVAFSIPHWIGCNSMWLVIYLLARLHIHSSFRIERKSTSHLADISEALTHFVIYNLKISWPCEIVWDGMRQLEHGTPPKMKTSVINNILIINLWKLDFVMFRWPAIRCTDTVSTFVNFIANKSTDLFELSAIVNAWDYKHFFLLCCLLLDWNICFDRFTHRHIPFHSKWWT